MIYLVRRLSFPLTRSTSNLSRKVARLMDSFRPGATSYCPFENKAELADSGVAPAGITEDVPLLRPSELGLPRPAETGERTEDREIELPGPGPGPGPAAGPSPGPGPTGGPSPTSLSAEEENRRRLYLNVGRPRPFYGVAQSGLNPAPDQQNPPTTALHHKAKVRHLTVRGSAGMVLSLPTWKLIIQTVFPLERRYADFTGNSEEPFSIGDWTGETF